MTDDIQLPLLENRRGEAELLYLSVGEDVLTPNAEMAPGEFAAGDFNDVRCRGVILPIVVTPAAPESPWLYDVKDGRRRLRACRKLFEAGLESFGTIPALLYAEYAAEDAETWASNLNSRRSPNALSDLESIQSVLERYEVDVTTKDGRRFLSDKTGIPVSTLQKRLKMLDMPQAFVKAAGEMDGDRRRKVPVGALESIAALNSYAQEQLLAKLKAAGSIAWEDVAEARANQTAGRVADMRRLPGFEGLPEVDLEAVFKVEPVIEVGSDLISLGDVSGEIVIWSAEEWTKDPGVTPAIVKTIQFAYQNGTDALRRAIAGNGNGNGNGKGSGNGNGNGNGHGGSSARQP